MLKCVRTGICRQGSRVNCRTCSIAAHAKCAELWAKLMPRSIARLRAPFQIKPRAGAGCPRSLARLAAMCDGRAEERSFGQNENPARNGERAGSREPSDV